MLQKMLPSKSGMSERDPLLALADAEENPLASSTLLAPTVEWLLEQPQLGVPLPNSSEFLDVNNLFDFDGDANLTFDLDENVSENCFETFQDLKYTSTPHKVRSDSGIVDDSGEASGIETPYKTLLHDITDEVQQSHNDSFISLTDIAKSLFPDNVKVVKNISIAQTPRKRHSTPEKTNENNVERNVSIIRKKVRFTQGLNTSSSSVTETVKPAPEPEPEKPPDSVNIVSEEEIVYYTGIKNYRSAVGILKFIRLPQTSGLTSYKKMLLTLMKLRLNLEWEDLSYRFSVPKLQVVEVFNSTLSTIAVCLRELLPWQDSANVKKRSVSKVFYLHKISDEQSQIILLIGEGKVPILFVSDVYLVDQNPLLVIGSECSSILIDGDIFCTLWDNTHYRLTSKKATGTTISQISKALAPQSKTRGIQRSLMTVGSLPDTYSLSVMSRIPPNVKTRDIYLACAALMNLNFGQSPPLSFFKRICQRSILAASTS